MPDSIIYTLYVEARQSVLYGYDAWQEMTCNDFLLQNFIGKQLPNDCKLPKHTAEYAKYPLNDFINGYIEAPFVSESAQKMLVPTLGDEAEFRSIGNVLGKAYYVMNVLNVVDCLDEEKSDMIHRDDGSVMSLRQAVFLPRRIPDSCVFKVPQAPTRIFATNRFVDLVRKHQLTGMGFEPANKMGLAIINHAFSDLPLRTTKPKKSVNYA